MDGDHRSSLKKRKRKWNLSRLNYRPIRYDAHKSFLQNWVNCMIRHCFADRSTRRDFWHTMRAKLLSQTMVVPSLAPHPAWGSLRSHKLATGRRSLGHAKEMAIGCSSRPTVKISLHFSSRAETRRSFMHWSMGKMQRLKAMSLESRAMACH